MTGIAKNRLASAELEGAPMIELFGIPGCSSCLRMKEFVEKTGLPYAWVNLGEFPERAVEVLAQSIHPPAARVGGRYANGVALDQVAELIGVDYEPPLILSPAELVARYEVITAALRRLISQLVPEVARLKTPERDRSVLGVAYHASSVMRSFLRDYDPDLWDAEDYIGDLLRAFESSETADEVASPAEALLRLEDTIGRFRDWWETSGNIDPMDRVIPTYWGHHTLQEALEREVWHTAQHARQVAFFLAEQGIEPDGPLTIEDLEGLPLPDRVYI